jgi:ATP-dependent DNA helicase Q1
MDTVSLAPAFAHSLSDSSAANSSGTVFFSAPLFRPNLHYKVLSKPSSAKAAITKMGEWINENHPSIHSF